MKELKVPTSRSYHEYLISSLKKPESAASYIEVMLELEEGKPEPELLRAGLKDVVDAYLQMNKLSAEAKLFYEKLDRRLSESGGEEIYALVALYQIRPCYPFYDSAVETATTKTKSASAD